MAVALGSGNAICLIRRLSEREGAALTVSPTLTHFVHRAERVAKQLVLGVEAVIFAARVSLIDSPGALVDGRALRPCLLYTSPSPRDATLSRMPSSA